MFPKGYFRRKKTKRIVLVIMILLILSVPVQHFANLISVCDVDRYNYGLYILNRYFCNMGCIGDFPWVQ